MGIAEMVLSIVKKREDEKEVKRLEELEKLFLSELKDNFRAHVKSCTEIPTTDMEISIRDFIKFSRLDFELMCRNIGLEVVSDDKVTYTGKAVVRIPEVEGNTKTPAQKLRHLFNKEVKSEQEANNALAKEICRNVFEKLRLGDFEYVMSAHGKYLITIKSNTFLSKKSKYVEQQVEKIFEENGLYDINIDDEDESMWHFYVHEKML